MQIRPTAAEFDALARNGNVIPVYGELLADLETPVSAFLKLDDGRFSFLLESAAGGEKVARFSFLGSRPRMLFTSSGRHVEISEMRDGVVAKVRRFETATDPLVEMERLMSRFRFVPVSTSGVTLSAQPEAIFTAQNIGPKYEIKEETRLV